MKHKGGTRNFIRGEESRSRTEGRRRKRDRTFRLKGRKGERSLIRGLKKNMKVPLQEKKPD